MSEREIWVVIGTTGEYSDRGEWLTRAFLGEESAKEYVLFLTTERQKLPSWEGWGDGDKTVVGAMRAFDPGYSEDYTGTTWYVEKVTLSESPLFIRTIREDAKGGVK